MGKIADPKLKTRAVDLTRGVPGVKAVRNELAQKS
jgi:osmotically-inducible protein OsmY